jgi:hypothetical protein
VYEKTEAGTQALANLIGYARVDILGAVSHEFRTFEENTETMAEANRPERYYQSRSPLK